MVREVIEVDCKGFLSKELYAFDTDLLVLKFFLLVTVTRTWPGVLSFEGLAELVDTVFLSRFISLHQNNLLKGH